MLNPEDIVFEVCPVCQDVRCQELFGDAWFKPPDINPEIPCRDRLCPHCDSHMPLVRRLELKQKPGNGQLELF